MNLGQQLWALVTTDGMICSGPESLVISDSYLQVLDEKDFLVKSYGDHYADTTIQPVLINCTSSPDKVAIVRLESELLDRWFGLILAGCPTKGDNEPIESVSVEFGDGWRVEIVLMNRNDCANVMVHLFKNRLRQSPGPDETFVEMAGPFDDPQGEYRFHTEEGTVLIVCGEKPVWDG